MVLVMKGKNFHEESLSYFFINMPDQNEESETEENEDLTAEKVFFSGFNKKLPVREQSTLSKITKVSLEKNSV